MDSLQTECSAFMEMNAAVFPLLIGTFVMFTMSIRKSDLKNVRSGGNWRF